MLPESVSIDARGLRCPWPAIRVARALRDGAALIAVRADDPAAARELAALAAEFGCTLTVTDDGEAALYRVSRDEAVNGSFTPEG